MQQRWSTYFSMKKIQYSFYFKRIHSSFSFICGQNIAYVFFFLFRDRKMKIEHRNQVSIADYVRKETKVSSIYMFCSYKFYSPQTSAPPAFIKELHCQSHALCDDNRSCALTGLILKKMCL